MNINENELVGAKNLQRMKFEDLAKNVCVTFPPRLLQQLDFIRHDIPRSKYLQRLLEQHMKLMELEQ